MARYIDADAFSIEPLKQSSIEFDAGIIYALRKLDEQPTADVVEVIRCKDCKYEDTCCRMIRNEKKPSDYCSYGERREDAEIH